MPPSGKPFFTAEQQKFMNQLVEDVANRVADILIQKGIGVVQQFQQQAPSVPGRVPGRDPRVPYQPVFVNRRAPDGTIRQEQTTVPQLLAEQGDSLAYLITKMDAIFAEEERRYGQ